MDGNFSVIIHGWIEGAITPWVGLLVRNLLKYRGGCVFVMDYSKFSNVSNYFALTPHFAGISAVALKKFQQIGNYDRQFCFGFSFGSRICMDVGLKIGNQSMDRMDVCDPAGFSNTFRVLNDDLKNYCLPGPGFDNYANPTLAAKSVDCINTSTDKGTSIYNCHRNYRMGYYGSAQPAAGSFPLGNHGLCPYFYLSAFTNDFVANNYYKATSTRLAKNLTADVKMGYNGIFNR